MSTLNNLLTESTRFDVILPPDSYAASANAGAWVNVVGYERVTFVVQLGDTIANPVAVKAQRASDSSGTDAADITGKAGTFTATDDDGYGIITIEQSDVTAALPYVTIVVTPDTAAAEMSAIALSSVRYSEPVDNSDAVFNV